MELEVDKRTMGPHGRTITSMAAPSPSDAIKDQGSVGWCRRAEDRLALEHLKPYDLS